MRIFGDAYIHLTPGHGYLLSLAYDRKTWAYSTNAVRLGHCGLSAASTHKLAFTSRHYALHTEAAKVLEIGRASMMVCA